MQAVKWEKTVMDLRPHYRFSTAIMVMSSICG